MNQKRKLFGSSRFVTGFTLIELLVVSGIVIFLSATVLINYRLAGEGFLLQRSSHKLAQDIRRTGELAMSAKEFQGTIPQGGYGVNLKSSASTSYLIYADTNGNQTYDEGTDGIAATIFLEKGAFMRSLSQSNLSINFKPPSPTIWLGGFPEATITLSLETDPSQTKIIKVNAAGLVEVE